MTRAAIFKLSWGFGSRRAFAISPIAGSMLPTAAPRGTVDFRVIGENWNETLRGAASIKVGTVAPSALMRRLAAYPKQNAQAKTLREIGRLERILFTLDWISDPALRRRSNAGLNKGEARNALVRAVFFHRLGEIRDRTFENQRYRASGLNLAVGEHNHLQWRLHLAHRTTPTRLPAPPKSALSFPRRGLECVLGQILR